MFANIQEIESCVISVIHKKKTPKYIRINLRSKWTTWWSNSIKHFSEPKHIHNLNNMRIFIMTSIYLISYDILKTFITTNSRIGVISTDMIPKMSCRFRELSCLQPLGKDSIASFQEHFKQHVISHQISQDQQTNILHSPFCMAWAFWRRPCRRPLARASQQLAKKKIDGDCAFSVLTTLENCRAGRSAGHVVHLLVSVAGYFAHGLVPVPGPVVIGSELWVRFIHGLVPFLYFPIGHGPQTYWRRLNQTYKCLWLN